MFEKVPQRAELVKGEHDVLDLWRETQAFDKLRKQNKGKAKWSFLDGPITANGFMGVHHAWGRTYKDVFQRYFAMNGYDQRWQNGFDCQGLWVEVQVERDLGFKSKKDIEEYGVEEFIKRCKERVWKYSAIQTEQSIRLGMWMDWENSYFTMSDENNYTIWGFLKRCHERGFIYKGLDAMPWCPRCGTGISEQERREGYKQVQDDSVYVAFRLRDRPGESLLVWTTTPWTLAANVAVAVNPELTYLKARDAGHIYYVSEGRLTALRDPEVIARLSGKDLIGLTYDGPFDELPAARPAVDVHQVIAWDEVSNETGTGLVHIATGCGKEDFELGKKLGFPIIAPIDESGKYVEGFGTLTGRSALVVAPDVYASLKAKGLFYKSERYTHDYPHCWRCDTALLFRAVDEWYIDMSWREEIKQVVHQIRWIPDYGLELELDWLKNMGDWMISKKRYWGLALPIYECGSCNWFDVVGSHDELQERASSGWDEFEGHTPHKPWIDKVTIECQKCGGVAKRIPDVGNPWLDAGIVAYSTVGYNTDREQWEQWIPADFVVESFPGQFRNWFYSMLAMSTMMENVAPFKTLLGYALVRAEDGEEMHYSKGNSIEFDHAADQMGADVMRWMYCRHNPTLNLNFGYSQGKQIERKFFGTLWNTYLFFTNYALLDDFDPLAERVPVPERPQIDRWILSNLQILVKTARKSYSNFATAPLLRDTESFVEELSNWYVRRNRPRFWDPKGSNERDKLSAYQTLYEVLVTLVKVIAPIAPFLSERLYQNLCRNVSAEVPESVHLCSFPEVDESMIDTLLSFQMKVAQQVAGAGRALREEAGHRVRQPLAELRVAASGADADALERLKDLILDELNVKTLNVVESLGQLTTTTVKPNFATMGPTFGKLVNAAAESVRSADGPAVESLRLGQVAVIGNHSIEPQHVTLHIETKPGWAVAEAGEITLALDTTTTDELVQEGLARDVVRHLQQLRKDSELNIEDRIESAFTTVDDHLLSAIAHWTDYICTETQSDSLTCGDPSWQSPGTEVSLGTATLLLWIRKI
ncbi:MAG: isoleucine--tRNA ligase [Actinomycetota bacterium]